MSTNEGFFMFDSEQHEMINTIGAEKLLLEGFNSYKSLVANAIYQGLETELATAFYTNILDFNYFYKRKLYDLLNIDYSEVVQNLSLLERNITKDSFDIYCVSLLESLVKSPTNAKENTLFIKELITIQEQYAIGSVKVKDILEICQVEYNKFLLSLYNLDPNSPYPFEDFDAFYDILVNYCSLEELTFIRSVLKDNFHKCEFLEMNNLARLYRNLNLVCSLPKSVCDNKTHTNYIDYLEALLSYIEYLEMSKGAFATLELRKQLSENSFRILTQRASTREEKKRIRKIFSRYLSLVSDESSSQKRSRKLNFYFSSVLPF